MGMTNNNLCNSCTNIGCEFQSGIVRKECAYYMPPQLEPDNCGNYVVQDSTTKNDCAEQNGCISCSLDDGDDCCRKLYEESMQDLTTKNDIRDNQVKNELNRVKDELEPTTKNCESCRYYGSHHEVCNYCYKCSLWTEQEPTTKNDIAVEKTDMIDKSNFSQEQYKTDLQSAYDSGYEQAKNDLEVDWESYKDIDGNSLDDLILEVLQNNFDCGNTYGYKVADEIIDLLPSVTPQESILDKIRADIGKSKTEHEMQIAEGDIEAKLLISHIYCDIINIFDKYMAESKRARK